MKFIGSRNAFIMIGEEFKWRTIDRIKEWHNPVYLLSSVFLTLTGVAKNDDFQEFFVGYVLVEDLG